MNISKLLLISLVFFATSCKGKIKDFYGADIFYKGNKREIIVRLHRFEQCVKNAGFGNALNTLRYFKIYLVDELVLSKEDGTKIIGLMVPERGIILVGAYGNYQALEHELLHAIGLFTRKHDIADVKLIKCL